MCSASKLITCSTQIRPEALVDHVDFFARYRRARRYSRIIVASCMVLGFCLAIWAPNPRQIYSIFVWLGGWFIYSMLMGTWGSVSCPTCGKSTTEKSIKAFCPVCGAENLKAKIFSLGRCPSCHPSPVSTRGPRNYLIHFCTHCGAHLDDTGV